MAMKSMSSAVNGLRAQQTAMDVIANNIANVNTSGFRSSTANFEDTFYQTLSGGTTETNPSQVGYGAEVADVSKNMTGGGGTNTNSPTDLYINGGGYFAIATSSGANAPSYYTRVGHFSFDSKGYLVDSKGNYVMGCGATTVVNGKVTATQLGSPICIGDGAGAQFISSDGTTVNKKFGSGVNDAKYNELSDVAINSDGTISASLDGTSGVIYVPGTTTASDGAKVRVSLANFVNEAGLTQCGNNYYAASQSSGKPVYVCAGYNGSQTKIQSNYLEMSNVDIAKEFTTMIQTQRGFQASSRVITTSDSLYEELVNLKRS